MYIATVQLHRETRQKQALALWKVDHKSSYLQGVSDSFVKPEKGVCEKWAITDFFE